MQTRQQYQTIKGMKYYIIFQEVVQNNVLLSSELLLFFSRDEFIIIGSRI